VTGPRLAGETGGGLGLSPESSTRKVLASTTRDRYLPVGAAAPGGPGAAFATKWPRIVIRNTRTPSAPGTKSPGVAEVSAFACVLSTAVIHDGAKSPSAFAARLAITVSTRLVPRLRGRGHEVIGSARSPGKAGRLRELGCEPIVLDALDAAAVRAAVAAARPDAIIYQATALAEAGFSGNLDRGFAQTNRLRTDGTDILLAAARQAGVRRFVAQSFAPYRYARQGSSAGGDR